MTLAERLSEYVRACFTGLWVQTFEADDALAEIARLCRQNHWNLACWDIDRGLSLAGQTAESGTTTSAADPLAAIRAVGALAAPDSTALLVLRNFHRFLGSAEIVQALDVNHDLPGREKLEAIARSIATEPGELPGGDELTAVLDAAAGLTRFEAEGAFSLSLVRHGRVAPGSIWELKTGTLKKSGLLALYRGGESFADLGGLEALKAFCTRALRRGGSPVARPRGILLLGVPGTGKSCFAKGAPLVVSQTN